MFRRVWKYVLIVVLGLVLAGSYVLLLRDDKAAKAAEAAARKAEIVEAVKAALYEKEIEKTVIANTNANEAELFNLIISLAKASGLELEKVPDGANENMFKFVRPSASAPKADQDQNQTTPPAAPKPRVKW